jgi:8-oxo-dGTP diphosphatase/2-hydroxy-dATP diphosphatase
MTLCYVFNGPTVLLGLKKAGLGVGNWNGFGGRVDEGETIEDAAVREVAEEAGIDVSHLEKVGILEFESQAREGETLEVHVFKTSRFTGEPKETDEMKPQWFSLDDLPQDKMWSSDVYWMPLFLHNKKFIGKFLFAPGDKVIHQEVKEVESF